MNKIFYTVNAADINMYSEMPSTREEALEQAKARALHAGKGVYVFEATDFVKAVRKDEDYDIQAIV